MKFNTYVHVMHQCGCTEERRLCQYNYQKHKWEKVPNMLELAAPPAVIIQNMKPIPRLTDRFRRY